MPDQSAYDFVDVLMFVANLAPMALYFLALGLVNSHSRPYLITCRSDFLLLTCVLMPLMIWPVPALVGSGGWWALGGACVVFAAGFLRLLPGPHTGFVVYNVSEAQCIRMLREAISRLGWSGQWDAGGSIWRSERDDLVIKLSKLAPLRNVTLQVQVRTPADFSRVADLGRVLHERLSNVQQLPSTMGAALVVIGVALLILPMWMVGRHIDDMVDAMSHLFG